MALAKFDYDQMCAICLDKWCSKGDHKATQLHCGHTFGYFCIKRWVKLAHNCPICKCRVLSVNMYGNESTEPSSEMLRSTDVERRENRRIARARRRAARSRRAMIRRRPVGEVAVVVETPENEATRTSANVCDECTDTPARAAITDIQI